MLRSDVPPVSRGSIGHVKDSFCECLKTLTGKAMAEFAVGKSFLVLRHIHDEACLRLRSFSAQPMQPMPSGEQIQTPTLLSRGRMSSVQNNHVTVFSSPQTYLTWYAELQALERKDAETLSASLLSVLSEVTSAMKLLGAKLRTPPPNIIE